MLGWGAVVVCFKGATYNDCPVELLRMVIVIDFTVYSVQETLKIVLDFQQQFGMGSFSHTAIARPFLTYKLMQTPP